MIAEAGAWRLALVAAALANIDPAGLGGVRVRARAGPLRDAWLDALRHLMPPRALLRRAPAGTDAGRLLGTTDIAATLRTGRRVIDTGLLAEVDGGVLVLAMAERVPLSTAAIIAAAMDRGAIRIEREGASGTLASRFALVALDEGTGDDEALAPMLADRLALTIELDGLDRLPAGDEQPDAEGVALARSRFRAVVVPDAIEGSLAELALSCGAASMRATLHLLRATRCHAALCGRASALPEDAVMAARLVLGDEVVAEAVRQAQPAPEEPQPAEQPPSDQDGAETDGQPADLVLAAIAATLPAGLLEAAAAREAVRRRGDAGRSGSEHGGARRGRIIGTLARPAHSGARPDILATLRAAAPWQVVRRGGGESPRLPLAIRPEDFRYPRRRERRGTTAIFAVDASGSAAVARLAEAKGAVELLLSQCYVRRDQVALIGFRGQDAEILLEPTRSLVRAKRMLASLPGGGATPLAAGIAATTTLALTARRRGQDTVSVFLTDGRGNIGADGRPGREAAREDALRMAGLFRGHGLRGIVIDTAQRPQPELRQLAERLGAEYVALPRGGSERISQAIEGRLQPERAARNGLR